VRKIAAALIGVRMACGSGDGATAWCLGSTPSLSWFQDLEEGAFRVS
jgi:hypothetical protein